jgi:hypothetical protein
LKLAVDRGLRGRAPDGGGKGNLRAQEILPFWQIDLIAPVTIAGRLPARH